MPSLKELAKEKDLLSGGHRLCPGCGASIAIRQVLLAAPKPLVVTCATGCLEVATTIFPYTAWEMPWMHSAFENAAATCSGIESAYKALEKKRQTSCRIKRFILLLSEETAEHTTSGFNHYQVLWKEATECFTSATTIRLI